MRAERPGSSNWREYDAGAKTRGDIQVIGTVEGKDQRMSWKL